MIAPDAKPIDHRSPYKRVDLAARRPRKEGAESVSYCPRCGLVLTTFNSIMGHECIA